jgi:hypothetical protein
MLASEPDGKEPVSDRINSYALKPDNASFQQCNGVSWPAGAMGVTMMNSRFIATTAGVFAAACAAISIGPSALQRPAEAQPGTSATTRLTYAKACAGSMGALPAFNCLEGAIIPVTRNGVAIWAHPGDAGCDQKALGPGGWECMPWSRIVDLSPKNRDDVITLALCRKDHPSQARKGNPYFSDIAVIQHNLTTGDTCFFQTPLGGLNPLMRQKDGSKAPSPQSPERAARAFWAEPERETYPSGRTAHYLPHNCTACHDAGPFVVSPWLKDGLQKLKDSKLRMAQIRRSKNGPYVFDRFIAVRDQERPWVYAHGDNPASTCAECHRFGSGSWGRIGGSKANLNGFMPPGDKSSPEEWLRKYAADVARISECVGAEPAASCSAYRAGAR